MENEQIQPAAERLRPMGMLVGTALMWSLHGLLIKWVDLHPLAIAGMQVHRRCNLGCLLPSPDLHLV